MTESNQSPCGVVISPANGGMISEEHQSTRNLFLFLFLLLLFISFLCSHHSYALQYTLLLHPPIQLTITVSTPSPTQPPHHSSRLPPTSRLPSSYLSVHPSPETTPPAMYESTISFTLDTICPWYVCWSFPFSPPARHAAGTLVE